MSEQRTIGKMKIKLPQEKWQQRFAPTSRVSQDEVYFVNDNVGNAQKISIFVMGSLL